MTMQNVYLLLSLILTSITLNLVVMKRHNKDKVKTRHIVESLLLTIGVIGFHLLYFN
ncbi:hypothetical protein P4493_05015 [Bacillus thuringiensis]|jgi:hypothetical protein|uniref:Membrane protein n=2 Tax=Bacillus cereus group TaxID=86661 RepID=A0A0B5N850_BACTU|nr:MULTISPECIES: hypothetical protein [Bacillus]MEC2535614.1 hypothetical protein [Bacillus cereus]MED1153645.1 hypothetical protein [Bacillus paranthracis]AJG73934.1 putative membrane protein [Bacillus thuringiensis]AJH02596.1 putative membrane protein [Bacillus thuringiensis HD1002]MCC4011944.1 hypothetical protein [Bacillus thuringiensis]